MPDPPVPPIAGQIAVAGSVGKASTSAMIAALLQASGRHTVQFDGRFLHSPLERLRVDGQPLDAEAARALLAELPERPSGEAAIDALLRACLAHLDAPWLVASGVPPLSGPVAEVVFAPLLPQGATSAAGVAEAITQTLTSAPIAVSALQRESALDVLRAAYPRLAEVAAECRLARGRADLDGQEFRLRTGRAEYRLHLPLLGAFQVENAATAVLAVEQLDSSGVTIDPAAARTALDALRLPGRLEVIKRRPLVIVDCNAADQAFRRTAAAMRELAAGRRVHALLDLSAGLDAAVAIPALAEFTQEIVALVPPSVLPAFRGACLAAEIAPQTAGDVVAAVEQALEIAGEREAVAVLGSAVAAGAARSFVLGLLPADDVLQ